jgi:hypothetical protein
MEFKNCMQGVATRSTITYEASLLHEQSRVKEIDDWNRSHIEEKDKKDSPRKADRSKMEAKSNHLSPIAESKASFANATPKLG